MLITQEIYDFAVEKYDKIDPAVVRKGITQSDGETVIELYFTTLQILVIPNALFKFTCP